MKFALSLAIAVAMVLLSGAAVPQSGAPAFELAALGSNNTLVIFRSDAPQSGRIVKITGAETVIGIDVRSTDGKLYALTTADTIHTIDARTGAATLVSHLGSPFDGDHASGFDFNPQSDRLRLVADTGQNLRVNVDVGAVAIDGNLRYAAEDDHSGTRPRIAASAYTNAFPRARSTTMFNIDHALDVLVRQDPPNDGTLATVGALGIDCTEAAGFDIATDAHGVDHAFAVCGRTLYRLDIKSGAAGALGEITGVPGAPVLSLAVLRAAVQPPEG